MSEVDKAVNHMPTGRPEAGEYYADPYNEAQHELAALREELAILKHPMNSARILRRELTAADQWNSVMRYALEIAEEMLLVAERHLDLGEDDSINFEPAILAVRAALKPAESGASE